MRLSRAVRTVFWVVLLAIPLPCVARVVRITMQDAPANSAARKSVPENYRVIQGTAFGELDPHDGHNRLITDIDLAPRNQRGNVEYSATFTLYVPQTPAPNAVLLYEVVNRGKSLMPREYANGDYFLLSGWQGDLVAESAGGDPGWERLHVPVARHADGSVVTGPAIARFYDLDAGQKTLNLYRSETYRGNDTPATPLDTDTKHAHLITRQHEDAYGKVTGEQELPADAWAWGDCEKRAFPGDPSDSRICLKNGADPVLLYELRYVAKDPPVLGIGFAAMRDVNSFFRYEVADTSGTPNPMAGKVKAALGVGISQSGNAIHSFLHLDMNRDEQGRIVWDGVMPIISARHVPLNVRFGVPGGTAMLQDLGSDATNWWIPATGAARKDATGGVLDRCMVSHSCPKIVELMGSTEFFTLRGSRAYTGISDTTDVPMPANVRRFYVASTTHGGGRGGFHLQPPDRDVHAGCVLAMNSNPMNPVRRALLLDLKQWVTQNRLPPASIYPTLKAGTLAPAQKVFAMTPRVPGIPLPEQGFNPALVYDTGSEFHAADVSGIVSQRPSPIKGATPSVLPTVDADGNEVGGIHTPLQQSPLGTYTGWNVITTGFRKGSFCSLTGGFAPFEVTKAERLAKHDPRLSIEERYKSHAEYVQRVRVSAEALVQQRLLLQDDADQMIHQAEQSKVLR